MSDKKLKLGWEIKKLGDICENLDSKRVPITKSSRVAGNIPYYGASGIVDYVSNYIFNEDLLCVSEDGANLLARTYPIAFSICGKTWVNNHAHVLKFSNIITQKFVELYLNSIRLDNYVSGMAQPKLNQTMLNRISIPVPPLSEQERIVSILDKEFSAIDQAKQNAEKNLKNAKELFDSYLNRVFNNKDDGWEDKPLNQIFNFKPSKKEASEKLSGDDLVTFLPMEDLNILSKEINKSKYKKLSEVIKSYTYFANNDVLMAKITPCFENGKLGIAKNLVNGIGFGSSEYIVFRSTGNVIPEFLFYFLFRNEVRKEGAKLMTGAVGHKRVSKEWIENYIFSFPRTISEQERIVQKLDALSAETKKLEEIYQQKITELEELKKSILQKAFNGELL